MNRIITRGFGTGQMIITRGFGGQGLLEKIVEVLRLVSKLSKEMYLVSKIRKVLGNG